MNTKKYFKIACALFVVLAMGAWNVAAQGQYVQSSQRDTQESAAESGARLYVSTAGLRLVQQQLNRIGYASGNVDGLWGDQTRQALESFQRMQGMEPTGNLNLVTIQALGLPQVLAGAEYQDPSSQRSSQQRAAGEGAPLFVSPATVRIIQQQLNRIGFDPGQVDGHWGEGTSNAIRNYEEANGLEPTGNVNLRLISSLGLGRLVAGIFGTGQGDIRMAQQGFASQGQQGQHDFQGQQGQQQRGYYGQQPGFEGQQGQQGFQGGQQGFQGSQDQQGSQGQQGFQSSGEQQESGTE